MQTAKEIRQLIKCLQIKIDQNNFSSTRQRSEAHREMKRLRSLLHAAKQQQKG